MLIRHSVFYFFARLAPALVTLAALSTYTRMLSPAEYGRYSLTLVVAMGINAILFQWINLALGRFLPECKSLQQKKRWVATAVYTWLLLAVVLNVVIWIFPLSTWLEQFALIFSVLGIVAAAQAWFDLALRFDNIALRPLRYGIASLIKSILALSLGYIALILGFKVPGVLLMLAVALLLSSLLQRAEWSAARLSNFDFTILHRMLRYGIPLTLTFLMTFVIDVFGRMFLSYHSGAGAVGVFSAAYEFIQYIVGTLLAVVHLAAFPLIVQSLEKADKKQLNLQLTYSFELVFAVSAAVCTGLVLCRAEIAEIVLGAEFRDGAIVIMPWIALALFFSVLKSYYFDYAFQLGKNTLVQLITVALGAGVTVISCVVFVPQFGIQGAALASCAGFASALLGSIWLGPKVFAMPSISALAIIKVLLAVGCMLFIVTALPELPSAFLNLLLKALVGLLVFVGVLVLTDYMRIYQLIKERHFG